MELLRNGWAAQAARLLSNPPALVAIVGGGGKTTLLYALGQYLRQAGKRVLLSTTTRMLPPHAGEATLWLGQDNPPPLIENGVYLWGAGIDQAGKLVGLNQHSFKGLMQQYDYILVEADGSRGLPLKFWRLGEPVLPAGVTDVLCIASLKALGQPVYEVLHGHEEANECIELPGTIDGDLWNALRIYHRESLKTLVPKETRITLIDRDPGKHCSNFPSPYWAMSWKHEQITVRPNSTRIAVVVLAAGAGSRFGGGKLTASLAGKPVLSWVLRRVNSTSLHPRLVVGGEDEGVKQLAARYGFNWVKNEQWSSGMGSSLKQGISWLQSNFTGGEVQGVLVMLGDMPLLKRKTIQHVFSTVITDKPQAAFPVFNAQRGHPVYFSRECFPALLTLTGDIGARTIISGFNSLAIKTDDEGTLFDIDTIEDMRRVEQQLAF